MASERPEMDMGQPKRAGCVGSGSGKESSMNTTHVIQYRDKGRWLNHYVNASSIAEAEAKAYANGIIGEGFEMVGRGDLAPEQFAALYREVIDG